MKKCLFDQWKNIPCYLSCCNTEYGSLPISCPNDNLCQVTRSMLQRSLTGLVSKICRQDFNISTAPKPCFLHVKEQHDYCLLRACSHCKNSVLFTFNVDSDLCIFHSSNLQCNGCLCTTVTWCYRYLHA